MVSVGSEEFKNVKITFVNKAELKDVKCNFCVIQ